MMRAEAWTELDAASGGLDEPGQPSDVIFRILAVAIGYAERDGRTIGSKAAAASAA